MFVTISWVAMADLQSEGPSSGNIVVGHPLDGDDPLNDSNCNAIANAAEIFSVGKEGTEGVPSPRLPTEAINLEMGTASAKGLEIADSAEVVDTESPSNINVSTDNPVLNLDIPPDRKGAEPEKNEAEAEGDHDAVSSLPVDAITDSTSIRGAEENGYSRVSVRESYRRSLSSASSSSSSSSSSTASLDYCCPCCGLTACCCLCGCCRCLPPRCLESITKCINGCTRHLLRFVITL